MSKQKSISALQALELGKKAAASGNNDEAMKYFDAVVRKYPGHKEAIAEAKKINPNSLFRHELTELNDLFKKGQFREVEIKCKMLMERFPDVTELDELLGAALASQGKTEEALPFFEKAVSDNKFKASAHYNLGNTYKALSQFEKATQCYARAVELKPDHIASFNNMSNIYRQLGQFDKALNCLNLMDELLPKNLQIQYAIAGTYRDKQDHENAIKCYEKCISLEPEFPGAYHDLALCYLALVDEDKAQKLFEKAIEIEPTYLDAYNNLGNILQKKGDYEGAIEQYLFALSLDKSTWKTQNNMGNAFRELGKFDEAVQFFEQAIALNPTGLEIIHNAANTYGEKSDFPAAIEKFERALELLPDGPVSISNLAIMNHIMGNEDKTADYIERLTDELLDTIRNEPRKIQFCHAYRTLLKRLYKHNSGVQRAEKPDNEKIWVVGPSLTLANRGHTIHKDGKDYIAEVKWIAGIKAFHLSQPQHNKYKSSVEFHLTAIPDGSEVIFNIGTIDTRVDEGITVAAKKLGKSVKEVAEQTASGYFDFSYNAALEAGLKPIHCGVAAPLTTLDVDGSADAIEAILEFNRVIKQKSEEKGILYIDVHKITVTEDGVADGSKHLDPFHLIPTAINEAINV